MPTLPKGLPEEEDHHHHRHLQSQHSFNPYLIKLTVLSLYFAISISVVSPLFVVVVVVPVFVVVLTSFECQTMYTEPKMNAGII